MNMNQYLRECSRVTDTTVNHGFMKNVYYSPGITTGGGDPPIGGWRHGLPFRLAQYQANYTGIEAWQSWSSIEFVGAHNTMLPSNNARNTVLLLMERNQASPSTGLPIPLGDYALRTQQVYYGGGLNG